jgi:hypothetical protein
MAISKTRNIAGHQVLGKMKAKRAERFLWDLANFEPAPPAAEKALRRLFSLYPDIFIGDPSKQFVEMTTTAGTYRNLLRKAWDTSDLRHREWYLYELSADFHKRRADQELQEQLGDTIQIEELLGEFVRPGSTMFDRRISEPSAETTALEEALLYLKKNLRRARHCANKDCAHPYFLQSRKGQKFCSEKCSAPALRAAKREWWRVNRGKKAH